MTGLSGVTKRAPGDEERQDFPRGRDSDFLSHENLLLSTHACVLRVLGE